jgi:sugar/nucleoside kinase (ribokinase family)
MLAERTGVPLASMAEHVEALIVTLGADGSVVHAGGATYAIPAAKPTAVLDPTGCGDAYRAGILYGIAKRMGLGTHRRPGVGARRHQDRIARRAEARVVARQRGGAVPDDVRHGSW